MRSSWLSHQYEKNPNSKILELVVNNAHYYVLINPDLGSWVALTEIEYDLYKRNAMNELQWEPLFLRGLAVDANDNMNNTEFDFPSPANYPSIVVVNITTKCNLRCAYCFANCEPASGEDMNAAVMEQVILQMLDMPENEIVTFEFQGGEASLNTDGLRQFINIAESLKHKFNKEIRYRIETNCVSLSDAFVNLVKEYDVKLGISLDGPRDMNDICRVNASGDGSFDEIVRGIEKLRANGIEIDGAVCTIGQHNVKSPEEILDFFNKIEISFKPRPVNILGRELNNNFTTKPLEWADCFIKMHKKRANMSVENFSIHIFEENAYTPIRDYICLRYPCGAARELISVNPDGEVYPCDGFKGERAFSMGNILHEKVTDMLLKPPIAKLRSRTSQTIEKCKECIFRGMCCSCCYSAYGKFGDIYREDPHCADRKEIFSYLIHNWILENENNT